MSVEAASTAKTNGHAMADNNLRRKSTESNSSVPSIDDTIDSVISCLSLDVIFSLGMKFYRSFESKAFTPSYEERNRLVALSLQSKYGPFDAEKVHSATGALDVVGRDRRQAWSDLGNLSKEEAKKEFICMLDNLCPKFKPFIMAHVKEEEARREREDLEKLRRRQDEEDMKRREEVERNLIQKKAIQDVLNRQTHDQFIAYAQQQYPGEEDRQQHLIKQLQENHYQQYMQQILQQQQLFSQQSPDSGVQDQSNHQQEEPQTRIQESCQEAMSCYTSPGIQEHSPVVDTVVKINGYQEEYPSREESENQGENEDQEEDNEGNSQTEEDEDQDKESTEQNIVIEPAKIWTRREEIEEFKKSVRMEGGGEGVIKLGHGEIVTINVPTHEEGNSIFWEFSTDYYDIGFGVLFEFSDNPGSGVSVHVTESDEEEDDDIHDSASGINDVQVGVEALNLDGEPNRLTNGFRDPERGLDVNESAEQPNPNLEVILPIFRRDSHEAVHQGCHPYPGKGVYRLKFDNSYSLWRSKTLYYKVYYTR